MAMACQLRVAWHPIACWRVMGLDPGLHREWTSAGCPRPVSGGREGRSTSVTLSTLLNACQRPYARAHREMFTHVRKHTHAHRHARAHIRTRTHAPTRTHAYTYTHIYRHTHARAHTHIHTLTHVHERAHSRTNKKKICYLHHQYFSPKFTLYQRRLGQAEWV